MFEKKNHLESDPDEGETVNGRRPPDADVIALAQEFRKIPVGEVMTYERMEEIVGYALRPDHRWKMERARDKVLREDKVHLVTLRAEGYLRVEDEKAVMVADKRLTTRIKGVRRRAKMTLNGVMIGKLQGAARTIAFALHAKQGLLGNLTRAETQKKLEAAVEGSTKFLATKDLLDKLK